MAANLDMKMLSGLSREIKSYLPSIREGIERFQNDTTQNEILDDTLRHIHTIKGASALMGLTALSQIAAYIEEILDDVISGQSPFDAMRQQWLSMTIEQIDPYLEALLNGEGENHEIVGLIESGYLQIMPGSEYEGHGDDAQIGNECGEYGEDEVSSESSCENQGTHIVLRDQDPGSEGSEAVQIDNGDPENTRCDNTTSSEELLNDELNTGNLDEDEETIVDQNSEMTNDNQEQYRNADYEDNLEEDHANLDTDTSKNLNNVDQKFSEGESESSQENSSLNNDPDIIGINQIESGQDDSLQYIEPIEDSLESISDSFQNSDVDTVSYGDLGVNGEGAGDKSDKSIGSGDEYDPYIDEPHVEIREDLNIRDSVHDTHTDKDQEPNEFEYKLHGENSHQINSVGEESIIRDVYEEALPDHDITPEDNVKASEHLEVIIDKIDSQIKNIYETVDQVSFRPSHLLGLDHNQRHLLFTIGQSHYAATVDNILEIGQVPSITSMPNVPGWLKGVINLRGEILSVVDLRDFFDDRSSVKSEDERLIVVRTEGGDIMTSFLVDQINGFALLETMLSNNPSDIFQDKAAPYLSGIFELNGMIFATLDIESLLKSTEINQFY